MSNPTRRHERKRNTTKREYKQIRTLGQVLVVVIGFLGWGWAAALSKTLSSPPLPPEEMANITDLSGIYALLGIATVVTFMVLAITIVEGMERHNKWQEAEEDFRDALTAAMACFVFVSFKVIDEEKYKELRWPFIWMTILGVVMIGAVVTAVALE